MCFSIGYGLSQDEGDDIRIFCEDNKVDLKIFKNLTTRSFQRIS